MVEYMQPISCCHCSSGRGARFLGAATGVALLLGATGAFAKPPTCSITSPQNDPVTVTAGGSAQFQGVVTDGVPTYDVTWTFEGGNPANASDPGLGPGVLTALHLVTFANPGTFTVTMAAQDSGTRGKMTCSAIRTVQVGGGTNSRPVAQDDEYNTTAGTLLAVDPPGVLSNDNDTDGDPMTAELVADVSHGTLNLASNGGFTYTPDQGFTGSDSFTYTANDAGGASNSATAIIGVTAADAVSINSTSAQGPEPLSPVSEGAPFVKDPAYAIVAVNDLGMHCGDLDTRISSILPPFNVLHSQVIQRGNGGLPQVLGEGQVEVFYSAISNPDDPAPARVAGGLALSSVTGNGDVYKTNFWDVAFQGYDPFYPSGVLALFYDAINASNNVDLGLPMPDVERFFLEDGFLSASQQAMPGISNPYTANDPQAFQEHIGTQPFFTNFAFGYTSDVNLFEAAGVPIAAFDDFGQENPYPLVRVQAEISNSPVATVDIVMPISGEAECQACHAAPQDGGNGTATVDAGLANIQVSIDDPLEGADVPLAASVEWASDINILRLHDQKHGTSLESGFDPVTGRGNEPVVCQRCHYTPALDLAQLGPLGPENDTSLDLNGGTLHIESLANGRDQVKHKSMSNVMHSHHASTGLFPGMPPAINAQGQRRSPAQTQSILEETCYRCHPGKRTQCMRGAMANGGLVCQDCHGQMAQVGDDFSRNVSPANPGAFELGPDFYTNPATPRVPWANEPSCGSCHTGYATDNLAGDPNVLVNPTDTLGNSDGIRLLAAYRTNDSRAAAIVPTNKAFAEDVVAEGTAADGNPKLYRVSTGHGGLMCEGCHGSTHAEWPVANPTANENVPSRQIQGHRGYIAQCQVCHEPNDASLPLGNNGPHGMHAIADLEPNLGVNGVDNGTSFQPDTRWNLQHRSFRNQGPGCESCHGDDLRGTVLSRTADERTVLCKDNKGSLPGCAAGQSTAVIPKGTPVGCGLCHRQK
jgi:hypothetical protein